MKIYIVDDDVVWSRVLKQHLTKMNITDISIFDNGSDCIEQLQAAPDYIFLDYKMEGDDGLSVLQKIKQYNENINVVFCTAYEDIGVALAAIEGGSADYLLKSNLNESELSRLFLETH